MKSRRKDKTERKNSLENSLSPGYAEKIIPLLLVGRRPETDAGWLGSDAGDTAARREKTAKLGYYPLVSREKRLNPQYLPGCQTFCRNVGGLRAAYPCLGDEQRG